MKTTKAKVPENLFLVPQLDDISNVHPRLIQLQEKLNGLSHYDLIEDDKVGISRAKGLLDAALMLEAINFDLMRAIVDELDDATVDPSEPVVRELYSMAIDIWADIPVGQFIEDPTEPLPPVELIEEDDECNPLECNCITWGCCGKELESENLALQQKQFTVGQRVRLTKTLLDETTDIHPVHLYEGDLGTVVAISDGSLGFQSDRWGDVTSIGRPLNGKFIKVLNYCESAYQCPTTCPECGAPEQAIYKTEDEFSPTGNSWLCSICNSSLSPAPAYKVSENGGDK